jgi:hypothetical protein
MEPDLITIHKNTSNIIITAYKKDTKMVNNKKTIYMNNYLLRSIGIYFDQII